MMGLILDESQQQMDLANLVKPPNRVRLSTFRQPTSSLQQTSNRSFLLGVLASARFRVEAEYSTAFFQCMKCNSCEHPSSDGPSSRL
jgi:hypothetical protein